MIQVFLLYFPLKRSIPGSAQPLAGKAASLIEKETLM
jgi:hypothetical protein